MIVMDTDFATIKLSSLILFLLVPGYVNWNLRLKMTLNLFEKSLNQQTAEIFVPQQVRELYNLYSSVF